LISSLQLGSAATTVISLHVSLNAPTGITNKNSSHYYHINNTWET
jgi:hypothetical protein